MDSSAHPARDAWLLPTLEGLLSAEQLAQLNTAREDSYWDSVIRRHMATDDQILAALATRFRMKIANVSQVSPQVRELVSEQLVRKYRVLPLAISDSMLDIATANPHDLDCEHSLAFALGRTVRMSLASPTQIAARLDEVFRPENVIEKILENVAGDYDMESIEESVDDAEFDLGATRAAERPVIRLVDRIVAEGIQSRASDIHLEPADAGVAVRYRIDGVLRQAMVLPRAAGVPLVSRVKIMAKLDIADRLRPQDGRARVAVSGNRVDLRVSTLPASQGEKVVIRILDQRATVLSLESLGVNPDGLERINQLLDAREGIVLVTGPTGSGKTTTLYSMLRAIQARGVNIVTVEDPVEYRVAGIVQVQVNEKTGLTFPAALRSILRQDPDVILVGEIRDKETANIAIQASLTGHLVLSTVHTIDASSAVTRLVDIGVERYKIAAALKGVLAQRLLRRLCLHCRALQSGPTPGKLRPWFPPDVTRYRAVGCAKCAQTGYRGRLALTEVLIMTPELERCIVSNADAGRLAEAAREGGMRSLWEAGVSHVRNGITTIDELLRVIEPPGERDGCSAASAVTSPATPASRSALPSAVFELLDGASHPQGVHGATKKVLLVEDEDALRRVMKDLLEHEGFTVFEAADGVHALDAIDRFAPDIVVLDLNLPRLDGYGLLGHLRSRPQTATLPVVVLTAKGDEASEVRVFGHGASDYLTKPVRARALSARLHALLNRDS